MALILCILIIIQLLFTVFASPAYAYLDPNAGGFFLQVILPAVFGVSAAITVFWRKLTGPIKKVINWFFRHNNSSLDE